MKQFQAFRVDYFKNLFLYLQTIGDQTKSVIDKSEDVEHKVLSKVESLTDKISLSLKTTADAVYQSYLTEEIEKVQKHLNSNSEELKKIQASEHECLNNVSQNATLEDDEVSAMQQIFGKKIERKKSVMQHWEEILAKFKHMKIQLRENEEEKEKEKEALKR